MGIQIQNICKKFGNFTALDSVSLNIKEGKLTALLGPSGSGKTTLLRIIAGLENADSGGISFFNQDMTKLHTKDRGVGFVFQHYALFKHMSVFENIAFGLKVRPKNVRLSKDAIAEKVQALLKMIQLESLAKRYPSELSGGQKQRVALARALAIEPKVLLLDEPFGALDAKVRQDLRRWLRDLHDTIPITSIFVTHDQEEALEVSDEIVIMQGGKIEQVGTPEDVYENPANPFVYSFLGNVNLFSGRIGERGLVLDEEGEMLFVRPHEVEVLLQKDSSSLEASIVGYRVLGARVRLVLDAQGREICAEVPKATFENLRKENRVFIRFNSLKSYKDTQWSEYVI